MLQFFSCVLTLGDCLNVIQAHATAAGSPVQQDCSAPGGQEMVVHLPACYILYRTVLFDLISSSCAIFFPIMSLFLLAVDGSAALSHGTAGRSLSSQSASVSSF